MTRKSWQGGNKDQPSCAVKSIKAPTVNVATHPHRHAHLRRSQGGRCRRRQTHRCTHTGHAEECHSCVCPSGSGLPHTRQLQVKRAREEMRIWTFLDKVMWENNICERLQKRKETRNWGFFALGVGIFFSLKFPLSLVLNLINVLQRIDCPQHLTGAC